MFCPNCGINCGDAPDVCPSCGATLVATSSSTIIAVRNTPPFTRRNVILLVVISVCIILLIILGAVTRSNDATRGAIVGTWVQSGVPGETASAVVFNADGTFDIYTYSGGQVGTVGKYAEIYGVNKVHYTISRGNIAVYADDFGTNTPVTNFSYKLRSDRLILDGVQYIRLKTAQ